MTSELLEPSDVQGNFYACEEDIQESSDSCDQNDTRSNSFIEDREVQVTWKSKTRSLARDMKTWGRFPRQKSGADADDINHFLNILEALGLLVKVFDALSRNLSRLQEELDCLDDGTAENLFGWTGGLQESVRKARQGRESCDAILTTAREWRQALQPKRGVFSKPFDTAGLAQFLEKALIDNERLQEMCFNLAAQRQAAVNRAKAAIELGDAECRASAVALLELAMQPSRRVDFPMVTEICERLASRPLEIRAATTFLMTVIKEGDAASNRQLKALTIMHELLYDRHVKTVICETEGIKIALRRLQEEQRHPSSEGVIVENIRMLASEIDRRCFAPSPHAQSGGCAAWFPRWSSSSSSEKAHREPNSSVDWNGRSEVYNLVDMLRRRGHHWDGTEGNVLDYVLQAFESINDELSRLHDEMDCLIDEHDMEGRIALTEAMQRIAVLLLATSQTQSKLLQWKQRLPNSEGSGQSSRSSPKPKDLGKLLKEVAATADSTKREVVVLRKIRSIAVERTKMRIEIAGAMASLEEPGKG